MVDHKHFPEPYWANTSSNRIIRDMVWQADEDMRRELDELIQGGRTGKKVVLIQRPWANEGCVGSRKMHIKLYIG